MFKKWINIKNATLLALSLLVFTPSFANAAAKCLETTTLVKDLNEKYNQHTKYIGTTLFDGVILEIFVSEDGVYTITMRRSDGYSCVYLVGTNWSEVNGNGGKTLQGKPASLN